MERFENGQFLCIAYNALIIQNKLDVLGVKAFIYHDKY